MRLKPISASDALRGRQLLPSTHNRFEAFRNRDSSGSSFRDRSASAKRKASDDGQSFSQPKVMKKVTQDIPSADIGLTPSTASVDLGKLELMNKNVATLYNISANFNEEVAKTKVDPELEAVLRTLCKFMDSTIALQDMIVNSLTVSNPAVIPTIHLFEDVSDSDMDTGHVSYSKVAARRPLRQKTLAQLKPVATTPPVDPKVKRFQDAIKNAEKSTLVFNLDMGSTKLLNEKSILSRATLALTAKAAVVEGKPSNRPSQDTIDALDDVLSIAEGATLFGKQTKVFRNSLKSDDPRNGTFFTVPVRYEFKDKDQKLAAEAVLRERCKAECTTPYPTIVRHCIKKVIEHVRIDYPEDYIKVQVDPSKFCLRVSRRSKTDGWFKFDDPVPLPEEAYNIAARTVPEDLVIPNLPVRTRREKSPPRREKTPPKDSG